MVAEFILISTNTSSQQLGKRRSKIPTKGGISVHMEENDCGHPLTGTFSSSAINLIGYNASLGAEMPTVDFRPRFHVRTALETVRPMMIDH